MADKLLFAAYPSAVVYSLGSGSGEQPPKKLKPMEHLLWGDELVVNGESADGQLYRVKVLGVEGWIRTEDTQPGRLLEIVFVDIGQGDGALVVTPDDKRYVIDAGQGDNMYRFLRWRFGFKEDSLFDAAIMSHSDEDHYGGFEYLFEDPRVYFQTVYSNGLMERAASKKTETLGKPQVFNGRKYITDLVTNTSELRTFLSKMARIQVASAISPGEMSGTNVWAKSSLGVL